MIFTVVFGGLMLSSVGCSETANAPVATMVFVDSVTNKPVVQPASTESRAINPATGKRTLRPAAYCDGCRKWHAIPSLEQVQRQPESLVCPKSKTRLRFDGPQP
jgi:hypothetical protein